MRELADSATLYTRAVAVSDNALLAYVSLFTGVYPEWQGMHHATLTEVLASHGYWTGESAADYRYFASRTGLSKGFEFAWSGSPLRLNSSPFYLLHAVIQLLGSVIDTSVLDRVSLSAADIAGAALHCWIGQMPATVPSSCS